MKVKCITKYQDLEKGRLINVGEELEVADARGAILINARVAMAVPTPTTEVATESAPKKKAPKKVAK